MSIARRENRIVPITKRGVYTFYFRRVHTLRRIRLRSNFSYALENYSAALIPIMKFLIEIRQFGELRRADTFQKFRQSKLGSPSIVEIPTSNVATPLRNIKAE